MKAKVGILIVELSIPGSHSLKEKRSVIRPLLSKVRKKFNISAAEIDWLDDHQNCVIGCSTISNDYVYTNKVLTKVVDWIEDQKFQIQLINEEIEMI